MASDFRTAFLFGALALVAGFGLPQPAGWQPNEFRLFLTGMFAGATAVWLWRALVKLFNSIPD